MPTRVILAACFMLLALGPTRAETVSEYQVKAELLERFTRFVDWPATETDPRAPFVIGVAGRNPFGSYLEQIAAARRIRGRTIEIRYVDDLAQVDRCQLLFIATCGKDHLARILLRTQSRPILTVADTGGFGNAGVLINFYTAGDTIRFEINEGAVEKSGLRVSSKLLKLARLVEREDGR